MSFRLTALPDYCRKYDIEPVIVDGFWTRGYEFPTAPIVSIDHHTAGPATGYLPSLTVLIKGRSDLPGPLCNGAAPRSEPGDNKIYLVASGKANHAGSGYWQGAKGNSDTVGLERELVGNGSDLTPWRNEMSIRWHAAVLDLLDQEASNVARHAEFALPIGRKPDTTGVDGDWLRLLVHAKLHPSQPLPPPRKRKTMDFAVCPGTDRIDEVAIGTDGNAYHRFGTAMDPGVFVENLGGNGGGALKQVSCVWVGANTFVVDAHAANDRIFRKVWRASASPQWTDWLLTDGQVIG